MERIGTPSRIAYVVQTYHQPAMAFRLVSRLRRSAPGAVIAVSHDRGSGSAVSRGVEDLADDITYGPGGRGDFSTVERLLDSVDRVRSRHPHVRWVVNLTGQDYPIRPLRAIEAELDSAGVDAYLEHFPALTAECRWGAREGRSRYLYEYRWLRRHLGDRARRLLRPLVMLNRVQPLARLTVSYGLAVGRRVCDPFEGEYTCRGGSFYGALSVSALDHLDERMQRAAPMVEHLQRTLVPEEAFLQTLLVGDPGLRIANSSRRYYDFRGSVAGRPRTLGRDDLPRIMASDAWFARKFDEADLEVLDLIDGRVHR